MIFQAFTTSLANVEQMDGTDLMMRLWMFFSVALILFVLGALAQKRKRGRGKWVKYVLGLLPVAMATWFSIDFFRFSFDEFARATGVLSGTREILFRTSPFICLGVGAVLIVAGIIVDRRIDQQHQDVL